MKHPFLLSISLTVIIAFQLIAAAETPPSAPPQKAGWETKTEELLKNRKIIEAIKYLQGEIEANPSDPLRRLSLIQILENGGQRDMAYEMAIRAADNCPNDFKCQLLGGYAHRERGDYTKAEECFKRAIEIDKTQPDAHRMLVMLYTHIQRHAEAVAAASKALEQFPDDYELLKAAATANYGAMNFSAGEKIRIRIAEIRKKLIESGRKELSLDEYAFHIFPIDEVGGTARVYDNFSAIDKPGQSAALFTFRIYDKDSVLRRAFVLNRRVQDGKTTHVLDDYRMPGGEHSELKSYGETPPTYIVCLNLVMDLLRKEPLVSPDAGTKDEKKTEPNKNVK